MTVYENLQKCLIYVSKLATFNKKPNKRVDGVNETLISILTIFLRFSFVVKDQKNISRYLSAKYVSNEIF